MILPLSGSCEAGGNSGVMKDVVLYLKPANPMNTVLRWIGSLLNFCRCRYKCTNWPASIKNAPTCDQGVSESWEGFYIQDLHDG